MKNFLTRCGITEDHRIVVCGVFHVYETLGLPLEIVLDELIRHSIQVSWSEFIYEALRSGMTPKSVRTKISIAVIEVYGHEYWKQIESRVDRSFRLTGRIIDPQSIDVSSSLIRNTNNGVREED